MSIVEPPRFTLARAEVHGWRGRCLDVFARAERAVSQCLMAARATESTSIAHLAGQRLKDLRALIERDERATPRQRRALESALSMWAACEVRRNHLAHGIARVFLDREGQWLVRLEFTDFRKEASELRRWTLDSREADAFEAELRQAFAAVSAQLGHFHKRLAPSASV